MFEGVLGYIFPTQCYGYSSKKVNRFLKWLLNNVKWSSFKGELAIALFCEIDTWRTIFDGVNRAAPGCELGLPPVTPGVGSEHLWSSNLED